MVKDSDNYPYSMTVSTATGGMAEVYSTEEVTAEQARAYVATMQDVADGKGLGQVTVVYLDFDGEFVDVTYHHEKPVPFERIRRITGYLVGDLSRFNDAKRAEVEQRVKHSTDKG